VLVDHSLVMWTVSMLITWLLYSEGADSELYVVACDKRRWVLRARVSI